MTTDWTSGYVADIGYTFGYYSELNPLHAKMAFLNAGLDHNNSIGHTSTHCELGFGQGVSANVHAAASGSTWYGNDFNPSQVAFAQTLSKISGANANLSDDSFEDFCNRTNLPEFDSIGLHGIWSWISDANRKIIVEFVRRKLKVGGVLYVSYNTLPGWASFAPVRHLLTQHAAIMGSQGAGSIDKVKEALSFTEKLMNTGPLYARNNPKVVERLQKIMTQDPHYLAHEYFNRDWQPMYFSNIVDWLAPAKLSFACSAHYLDQIDQINLSSEKLNFLNEVKDPYFKETVRDYMVNQNFRRDYWVKGPQKINNVQQQNALRKQKVVLTTNPSEISLKVRGALGEATMNDEMYQPLLQILSDYKPRSVAELESDLKIPRSNFGNLNQAIFVLAGSGVLSTVQDEDSRTISKPMSQKLNSHLIEASKTSEEVAYLASPVTGGGVPVNRFQKLFLSNLMNGMKSSFEISEATWKIVSSQGQQIRKEGKILSSDQENIAAIAEHASSFMKDKLPVLKALQVI